LQADHGPAVKTTEKVHATNFSGLRKRKPQLWSLTMI